MFASIAAMAAVAFAGGMMQGIAGFGAGIVQMLILPWLFPLNVASGIAGIVACTLTAAMLLRYGKYVKIKKIALTTFLYALGGFISINFASGVDQALMKRIFGGFLIVLSVYFLFIQKRGLKIEALPLVIVIALISGVCDGLFAIGSPLMVILYLAMSESKEEYLANTQSTFFVTGLSNTLIRMSRGILELSHLPYIITGVVMIWAASFVAGKVSDRIDGEKLKRIAYYAIGVTGIINLLGL